MKVAQEFAPPFKLIAPYFIIGTLAFVISCFYLFTIDISKFNFLNPNILSLVHIFLLGFVMMIIFGAMAQMIPVTLEVGHFSIEFYYIIYPLLTLGTILMAFGFYYSILLPFAGILVLLSMFIFIIEFFLTIRNVKKFNNVINSLITANIFLLIGLIIGIMMALTYSGLVIYDIYSLLKAHVFLIFVGYICLTIMALSLILLPMFTLSHNYSKKPLNISVVTLSIGVILLCISSLLDIKELENIAYILISTALLVFFYQSYLIYKTRARKKIDIYIKSLFFAFYSLILSILFSLLFLLFNEDKFLHVSVFLITFGFFTFLIIAHLYKIVPFLVWFDKFAPLVGKEKIPMLKDMIPDKSSLYQFYFTSSGIIICAIAFLLNSDTIFKAGASFLFVGAIFLFSNLIYMIRFK